MSKPNSMRVIAYTVLVAIPALAITACSDRGSSDIGHRPGADGVREVIPVYARALADGDGQRACSLMSQAAQAALEKRTKSADCLQGVKTVAGGLDAQSADALRDVKMKEPQVDGGKAAVEVNLDPGRQGAINALGSTTLTLVQIDARWHLDGVR